MADTGQGLRIERRFTVEGHDPYESSAWSRRESRIANPDGSVVFEMKDTKVPSSWSQVATDIIVSKYFRKAGVPQVDDRGAPIVDRDGNPRLGTEHSAKDVFDRLAETWRHWGESYRYFDRASDAQAFEDELKYMLANQMAAPNSPQWFNHRPGPQIRHHRHPAGLLVRQRADRRTVALRGCLLQARPPCLLHPVGSRRPGQRRGHHGPLGS